jgi:hypothetical protein
MAVLARPQLDGSFDVTERRLPKIGCREWVDGGRRLLRNVMLPNDSYDHYSSQARLFLFEISLPQQERPTRGFWECLGIAVGQLRRRGVSG